MDLITYSDEIFCYKDKEVKGRYTLSGSDSANNVEIRVMKEELKKLYAQIKALLNKEE